jgi:tetrahydromethanopterin S-methyltransferase subunit G
MTQDFDYLKARLDRIETMLENVHTILMQLKMELLQK